MNLSKKLAISNIRFVLFIIGISVGFSSTETKAEIRKVDVIVKSVDVKERTIIVTEITKSKSKDIELEVSKKAKILIGKKEMTLDSVRSGQKLAISFDDEIQIVIKIETPSNSDLDSKTKVADQKESQFEDMFSEEGLTGWYLKKAFADSKPDQDTKNNIENWEYKGGILTYKRNGRNLVSDNKFNDFELELEFNLPKDCNCGIFLRGRYELKLVDTPKRGTNTLRPDNRMGAIYGKIAPTKYPYKGMNQWNKLEVRLIGKTVTVKINDEIIIDEKEIIGPVNGQIAIDTNEDEPGPIMFFAHPKGVGARFRNIKLKQLDE